MMSPIVVGGVGSVIDDELESIMELDGSSSSVRRRREWPVSRPRGGDDDDCCRWCEGDEITRLGSTEEDVSSEPISCCCSAASILICNGREAVGLRRIRRCCLCSRFWSSSSSLKDEEDAGCV